MDGRQDSLIDSLLDMVDAQSAAREDFQPCMARGQARAVLLAALRLYGCRAGSAAQIYAHEALFRALDEPWPPAGSMRPARRWWRIFGR